MELMCLPLLTLVGFMSIFNISHRICAWFCCDLISFNYTTSNSRHIWFIYQYSSRLLHRVNTIEVTLNDMGKSAGTLQQQNTIKCEPLEGTAVYIIRITHIGHTLDPFYQYGLTETEACINRPVHYHMWNVIIYPCSYFNCGLSKPPLKSEHAWVITSHCFTWIVSITHSVILMPDLPISLRAVCFQFAHLPCEDWENINFVLLSSSNRKYELLPIV